MSPSQELSNTYGSNTYLVEIPTVLACDLYTKLKDAIWDLDNELSNIDTSNASEFIDELGNIITSDLRNDEFRAYCASSDEWMRKTLEVNLPFTKPQLLRLTRNAFASLICDRIFSTAAHKQIGEIHGSVIEVINTLFDHVPQLEPVTIENPTQEAESLSQMIASSNRYGIISLADARNTVRELIDADARNDELIGGTCGRGLNELINVLLEHISDNVVSCHEDLNNFLEHETNGYITLSIPCNHHELMTMTANIFSKIIDAMQPTNREMSEIRSFELSFKQTLGEFHRCLVANEIKAYASIS